MRILLKISGDALKWEKEFWIDSDYVTNVVKTIKQIYDKWNEIAIVVWWWNIYRWGDLIKSWVNSADSHNLSMLSTVFNWVVLKNFLEKNEIKSVVVDPNGINFVEKYSKNNAKKLFVTVKNSYLYWMNMKSLFYNWYRWSIKSSRIKLWYDDKGY